LSASIAANTETIGGVSSTYAYAYDSAGRLTDITTNGTATAHYEYDLNGNRVSVTTKLDGVFGISDHVH